MTLMRKADAVSRRPFRVLGPVTPTSYDEGVPTLLSVRDSGATHAHAVTGVTRPHFRPKLSPVSQSRAARVMEELRALNRSQPLHNPRDGRRGHVCRRVAGNKHPKHMSVPCTHQVRWSRNYRPRSRLPRRPSSFARNPCSPHRVSATVGEHLRYRSAHRRADRGFLAATGLRFACPRGQNPHGGHALSPCVPVYNTTRRKSLGLFTVSAQ